MGRNSSSWQSYIVPALAMVALVASLTLDSSPEQFPLPYWKDYPDSYRINVIGVRPSGNRIYITVRSGDFIQFPQDALLSFLTVAISSESGEFNYSSSSFWDYSFSDGNTHFCIIHPIAESVRVRVFAHIHLISEFTLSILNVSTHPSGYSWIEQSHTPLVHIHCCCFNRGTLNEFTQSASLLRPIQANPAFSIPISTSMYPLQHFCVDRNLTESERPVVIFSHIPDDPYKFLTDFAIALSYADENVPFAILESPSYTSQLYGRSAIKLNDSVCYSHVFIAKSSQLKCINNLQISRLRSMFGLNDIETNGVLADKNSITFLSGIGISKFSVLNLSESIGNIAKTVASSRFYFASSTEAAAFSLFLAENSTFVDISSNFEWIKTAGIRYLTIPQNRSAENLVSLFT